MTTVYRHYDSDGVLLYVGVAKNATDRTAAHRRVSIWFQFTARTETAEFDARELALAAEAMAIKTELPLFNLKGSAQTEARAVGYLVAHDAVDCLMVKRFQLAELTPARIYQIRDGRR